MVRIGLRLNVDLRAQSAFIDFLVSFFITPLNSRSLTVMLYCIIGESISNTLYLYNMSGKISKYTFHSALKTCNLP